MSLRVTLLILILAGLSGFSAPSAKAGNKYLFFMGGEGDPPGTSTIFDGSSLTFAQRAKLGGWIPEVAFDGDHPDSAQRVNDAFGIPRGSRTHFSQSYIEGLGGRLIDKVRSGAIKKGDSVLLYIDTHGAEHTNREKTHQVVCLVSPTKTGLCSLDSLQKAIRVLEAKGVKVALLDFSCYSGATLALKSPKTCVISATSAHTVGWSAFSNRFTDQTLPGKSLERIFLDTRGSGFGVSQISSPVGLRVQKILDPIVGSIDGDKFIEDVVTHQCAAPSCNSAPPDTSPLSKALGKMISDFRKIPEYRENFKNLDEAITRYRSLLAQAIQMRDFIQARAQRQVTTPDGPISWATIAASIPEKFLQVAQEVEHLKAHPTRDSGKALAKSEELLRKIRRGMSLRDRMMTGDPEFRKFARTFKTYSDWLTAENSAPPTSGLAWTSIFEPSHRKSPLVWAADDVRYAEKSVYRDLYEKLAKSTPRGPDPCQEFKF